MVSNGFIEVVRVLQSAWCGRAEGSIQRAERSHGRLELCDADCVEYCKFFELDKQSF